MRKFVYLLLPLLLSSCAQDEESRIKRADENRMAIEMDHSQCISYGFPSESAEYKNCRNRLANQRNQQSLKSQDPVNKASTNSDINDATQEDAQARLQRQNPGKVCTTKYCY